MKTIWKYNLDDHNNVLKIPKGYRVLSVIEQFNKIVLYCMVDPSHEMVDAYFDVIGTGWDLLDDKENQRCVGTVATHKGGLVWHVFWK